MKYVIGCDFGGGAAKAILLCEDGSIKAETSCEYPTLYPKPGWAEQNPEDLYQAFLHNVKGLLKGVNAEDVVGLACSGATHSAVLLDQEDKVIRPAIYWTDVRAEREAEELEEYADKIAALTFNYPGALWTLPQLMWLRRREPETFEKIRKIMSMKDYVRYRLTGDYVTDRIEACGFMLYDVRREEWSPFLCGLAGLDPKILPEVVSPGEILSPIRESICLELGLLPNTKAIAGATDTVMEILAVGAICQGQATVKLATAGRICKITDRPLVHPDLVCYPHVIDGLWYPGTATKSCAASFRWYRDVFGRYEKEFFPDAYQAMSEAAGEVPPGAQGLFFHPYLQGELTPYRDETLEGSFVGIRAFHTKAHFTRAVLEGISYSLKDCLGAFPSDGKDGTSGNGIREAMLLGGGAKGALWRQITADMLKIPLIHCPQNDSSLGTAMLAGTALGLFASYEESVRLCVHRGEYIRPDPKTSLIYENGFSVYKMIQQALEEVYHWKATREGMD